LEFGKIFEISKVYTTRCKDLGIRIFGFVAKSREHSETKRGKLLTDNHI